MNKNHNNDPIDLATNLVHSYYEDLLEQSITGDLRTHELKGQIDNFFDFEVPKSVNDVFENIINLLKRGGIQTTHPAYFGLFNPRVPDYAVAASTIVAALNPQLGAASHGRAAILLEQHILKYLAKIIGYHIENFSAHFTSGGQEANTEAVIISLTKTFPTIRENGLQSLTGRPVAYVSEEAHHSFEKAAHITGIGREAIRRIPIDNNFVMDMHVLKKMIVEDRNKDFLPFLVVGTAGSTTTGVIDPLNEISDFCQSEKLWFHCDAAWGGTALLFEKTRTYFQGIEQSDSVTWDAHKWLQMPLGTSMFFTSHPEILRTTFSTDSPYMPPRSNNIDDLYDTSMQWSRRGAGIPLLASFAILGHDGIKLMVEKMIQLGKELSKKLEKKGFKIINKTPLPVICFTHPKIESGNIPTIEIAKQVDRAGRAWIAPVKLQDGRNVLRACITNHLTSKKHLNVLIEELEKYFSI